MEYAELYAAITIGLLTALLYVIRLIGLRLQSDYELMMKKADQIESNTNGQLDRLRRENELLREQNEQLRAIMGGRRVDDAPSDNGEGSDGTGSG